MKKLLMILIFISVIIISTRIKAQDEDMNIAQSILRKDVKHAKFAELEPNELMSFSDFSKKRF
jgi:hypothetical protein